MASVIKLTTGTYSFEIMLEMSLNATQMKLELTTDVVDVEALSYVVVVRVNPIVCSITC